MQLLLSLPVKGFDDYARHRPVVRIALWLLLLLSFLSLLRIALWLLLLLSLLRFDLLCRCCYDDSHMD